MRFSIRIFIGRLHQKIYQMIRFSKKILKSFAGKLFGVDVISRQVFGNEISRDLVRILSRKSVLTVFDVGANLGNASLEFSLLFKEAKIHAFEPDPGTFQKLNQRLEAEKTKVLTYNFGFGSVVEWRNLTLNKVSGGNSFLDVSPEINAYAEGGWTEPVGSVRAEIKTVNSFCVENKIETIDLIKIDTQGYELEILKGGDQFIVGEKTRAIYIEVLFVELYKQQAFFQEIYKELTDRGFRFAGFYNPFYKVESPYYLLWCDALFVSEKPE